MERSLISFIFSILAFISGLLLFKYLWRTKKGSTYVLAMLMFSLYLSMEVAEDFLASIDISGSIYSLAKSFFIMLGLISMLFAYYPTCSLREESR
ncbi:MAG: hypothetical protein D6769_03045 [Methanobacteriota archaeon]|nr:MAG: hypothetical protein D6769_03045 [Euryarchaeota archaeon]